ncbi:hypothetical protein BKA67DRAFT_588743 [Truncatella angustata]|uniref:Uncharacterized protein n=1 Tax=Truncatella angustata TaxID=152316 RepID=A0A9P8U7N0_9PEZI|nr:uncharacterized protein BKA67DRAFT_588743 [Truncatella angustata]KAH6638526.1 hypothetical protein BKA67DRAFT_588743 [Truncatella angustata]
MSSKSMVLVTGANSYIACQTIAALLGAGYSVQDIVLPRKSVNGLFEALPAYVSERLLNIVELPPITVELSTQFSKV